MKSFKQLLGLSLLVASTQFSCTPEAKKKDIDSHNESIESKILDTDNSSLFNEPKPNVHMVDETEQNYEATITGEIIHIDEESFPFTSQYYDPNVPQQATGQFQYEVLRIKDQDNSVKKIVFPFPTTYVVGDEVDLTYTPQKIISLDEIFLLTHARIFPYNRSMQEGLLDIDGFIRLYEENK